MSAPKFDLILGSVSHAQLITHAQALLELADPQRLRDGELHNAIVNMCDKLGQSLDPAQLKRVALSHEPPPPPPRKK
jgi:hypothetical protein